MRKYTVLCLPLLLVSACEIGDGSFDSGLWDADWGFDDDASSDEDDAGSPPRDAGPDAGRDAGSDAGKDAGMDAGMDSGAPNELKASDVPAVIARGLCGAAEACIGKAMLLSTLEGNDCVEYRTKQEADRHLHWLQQSIDAGRVRFHPELLAECERQLIALSCDAANRRLPSACESALEGLARVDQDCTIDQDCDANAWCDKGAQETCPGTCAGLQAEGMPCQASRHCDNGLICEAGNCTAPRSEGDDCNTQAGEGCPFGLVCHGRTGQQTCRSIASVYVGDLDAECDGFGTLCKQSLVCQSQSSTTTVGKCVQPAAANGTCRLSQPSQCPTNQYCKDARTNMTERAPAGQDGVCSNRPGDGVACVEREECAPGTVCVGEPATCRKRNTAGGACESNAQCYGGRCEEDICVITTISCE